MIIAAEFNIEHRFGGEVTPEELDILRGDVDFIQGRPDGL